MIKSNLSGQSCKIVNNILKFMQGEAKAGHYNEHIESKLLRVQTVYGIINLAPLIL